MPARQQTAEIRPIGSDFPQLPIPSESDPGPIRDQARSPTVLSSSAGPGKGNSLRASEPSLRITITSPLPAVEAINRPSGDHTALSVEVPETQRNEPATTPAVQRPAWSKELTRRLDPSGDTFLNQGLESATGIGAISPPEIATSAMEGGPTRFK